MKDLLGNPLTPSETALHEVYERLKSLARDPALAPTVACNVRLALAVISQAVTAVDLAFEPLDDLGI